MKDLLLLAALVAVWWLLARYVLPKFGIQG